ncbi:MAG: hypothetical protein HRU14_13025 [Planctomycetes bacterium]|nr:hypothetical protein [Planctomycetota bacterium]
MSGRAWLGLGFIVAVVTTVSILLADVPGVRTLSIRLGDHVSRRLHRAEARFELRPDLSAADPVYSVEGETFALQGRVVSVSDAAPWTVKFDVDPSVARRFGAGTRVVAMNPDGNLAWVLKTLVPPALRGDVLGELGDLWDERRDQTMTALRPYLLRILGDIGSILGEALPAALEQHDVERNAFFKAFSEDIFSKDLGPVLEREFVTRLEERLGPLAGTIGAEIWDTVSFADMMSLSWIATKDVFGAAQKEEMAKRLSLLLEKKALPVFKKHAPTAFREAGSAVVEGFEEPAVQAAFDRALNRTLEHQAFQDFLGAVVDTWIVNNTPLQTRLIDALESDELRKPLNDLWKAAEPLLESALEEILTRADREGMDHQLVRVLRRVVLKKDKHYLVLEGRDDTMLLPGLTELTGVIGEDR